MILPQTLPSAGVDIHGRDALHARGRQVMGLWRSADGWAEDFEHKPLITGFKVVLWVVVLGILIWSDENEAVPRRARRSPC